MPVKLTKVQRQELCEFLDEVEGILMEGHGGPQKDNGCNKCEVLWRLKELRKELGK